MVGSAVNDVIHLVAELVENATTFSPPTTRVELRADIVGNGFAVEIEDRGLGLTPAELADINERLASPPEFDLANSDQLGLFVVGQLAARHGIRVSLRDSPYGGSTAIVLMPHSVIVREGETRSRAADGTGQPAPAAGPVTAPPADATGPIGAPRAGFHLQPDRPAPAGTGSAGRRGRAGGDGQPGVHQPREDHQRQTPGSRLRRRRPGGRRPRRCRPAGSVGPGNSGPPGPGESAAPAAQGPDLSHPSPAAGTHRGLPRRIRQASIAPQLRGHAHAEPAPVGRRADAEIEERSPELTRTLLSSLQQGWQRGRVDDLDYPDGPDEWPGGRPGRNSDSNDGEAQ